MKATKCDYDECSATTPFDNPEQGWTTMIIIEKAANTRSEADFCPAHKVKAIER